MREIKFRGRDLDGKWQYGQLFIYPDGGVHIIDMDGYDDLEDETIIQVDKDTVGQYTGLKDSDGEEIYEGDVVLVSEDGDESKHEVRYMDDQDYPAFDLIPSSVRWSYECNGLSYCMVGYDTNIEIRVIGNVHDNPNLLEVAHD